MNTQICVEVNTHTAGMPARAVLAGRFLGDSRRSDALCLPRVSMHRSAGRLVKVGRVLGRPPDGRQTEPSVNCKAGQHVQDYTSPGSNVELGPAAATAPMTAPGVMPSHDLSTRLSVDQYHRGVPSAARQLPASAS